MMPRYVAFFALVALAAAYPAGDDFPVPISTITEADYDDPSPPWFRFPPFGNIFAPLTKLFSSFAEAGPRIEVDDDKFRVVMNVNDYKKEDLKVKVKGDFIMVQGAHEAKRDEHDLFASQFFHTYTLPVNASAKDVTAVLTSDGYLDVTAPVNGADEKYKGGEIVVPIVESGKPLKEEKVSPAPAVPENVETVGSPVEPVAEVNNVDKVETLDASVEPLAKVENANELKTPVEPSVENVDKAENLDAPIEPLPKAENIDKTEIIDTPIEPLAKSEDIDKSETKDLPVEPLPKAENIDKPETIDAPLEPLPKTENINESEAINTPIESVAKVEDVDKTEPLETPVEPAVKPEIVDRVETVDAPLETGAKVEQATVEEKPEAALPASDDVAIEDIKVPEDNALNEIQP